mmetsp:Transcript_31154/g.42031  ORF Transcript_31154/g.42031 Transcript_31154/m.42031 type:complete len:235 (+) Transcript_31154:577-1281(+)
MLELGDAAPPEGCCVTIGGEANRVPESHWGLHAQLILKGALGQPHIRASGANSAILEKHGHDRGHRQAAVRDLRIQLLLPHLRVGDRRRIGDAIRPERVVVRPILDLSQANDKARGKLAWRQIRVLVGCKELHGEAKEDDLLPANSRHLGKGSQAIRHIGEFQTERRCEVAGELEVLRNNVADARQHADPAVLDLHTATAVEVKLVAVGGEAGGVPEACGRLHAELVLEGPEHS